MSITSTLHPHPNNQDVKHDVVTDVGSDAFALLLTRIEELQLEPDEVMRIESSVFADLAEACVKCESKDRCEHDLCSAGVSEHDWESYCPNAATLIALADLPWFVKAGRKATRGSVY